MRHAGLVACANRKNRAAGAGSWYTQRRGTIRPPHVRGCQNAMRWSRVTYAARQAVAGSPDKHEPQRMRESGAKRTTPAYGVWEYADRAACCYGVCARVVDALEE